jgi:hypothetical protein
VEEGGKELENWGKQLDRIATLAGGTGGEGIIVADADCSAFDIRGNDRQKERGEGRGDEAKLRLMPRVPLVSTFNDS